MPNAECRMPNAECRTPNAARRTLNPVWYSLGLHDVTRAVGSDRDFRARLWLGCLIDLALWNNAQDHSASAEVGVGDAFDVGSRHTPKFRVLCAIVASVALEDRSAEKHLRLAEVVLKVGHKTELDAGRRTLNLVRCRALALEQL